MDGVIHFFYITVDFHLLFHQFGTLPFSEIIHILTIKTHYGDICRVDVIGSS